MIIPRRAILSEDLRTTLKRSFDEESTGGYTDGEIRGALYTLCKRNDLAAHLVDATFTVTDEAETLRQNSHRLLELGYAGRDMELAWFLSFANQHSKPAGAMLVVSDTIKEDGRHEDPFGDPARGQELFTVPEIAKESTRKVLHIATRHALDRN